MKQYLKSRFYQHRMARNIEGRNVHTHTMSALGMFLDTFTEQAYIFDDIDPKGNVVGAEVSEPKRYPVAYELGSSSRRVKIHLGFFRKWAHENGFQATTAITKMKAKRIQSTLGTKHSGTRGQKTRVLLVDL